MRRIFTSTIFAAALVVASFNSFGQITASVSTSFPSPSPSPGFGTNYSVTTGEGFTGTRTPINVFPVPGTSSATTPGRFSFNSDITTSDKVYFRVNLDPNGNKAVDVTSYSISVKYGGGVGVTQTSTSSTPATFTIPNAGQLYYFAITGITIPRSTNFQMTLTLTFSDPGGTTSNVTLSSFSVAALDNANGALPVKFETLDARTTTSNAVSLKWNVASEDNLEGYEVEKSADGRNFSKIGFVGATGESNYSFVDTKAGATTYYRIKSLDINGRYAYSTVALVKAGKSLIVLKAFPSPFIKNISVQHGTATGKSLITVSSEDGRTIKSVVPAVGSQQTDIDLSSAKAGMYLVRYTNGDGQVETLKVLKQQ